VFKTSQNRRKGKPDSGISKTAGKESLVRDCSKNGGKIPEINAEVKS